MDEFDQKKSAAHLDLYRFDGRFYDLSEENGVLRLQLRGSVRWERSIIAVLVTALCVGCFTASVLINPIDSEIRPIVYTMGFLLPIQFGMGFVLAMKRGEVWKFDRNAGNMQRNSSPATDFSKIRSVRAWRRGSRFYIALQLRYGQTKKLGFFGFSRSERAWRDDAAQIAEFLGVPLDIPAV